MKNARPTEVKPSALLDALTSAFIIAANSPTIQQAIALREVML